MACNRELQADGRPRPDICAWCGKFGPCREGVGDKQAFMKGVDWDGWTETFGYPVYGDGGELIGLVCGSNNDLATDASQLIDVLKGELERMREEGVNG